MKYDLWNTHQKEIFVLKSPPISVLTVLLPGVVGTEANKSSFRASLGNLLVDDSFPRTSISSSCLMYLFQVTVKEEPLSEEDMRAHQKDRQKKDNHNMSKYQPHCTSPPLHRKPVIIEKQKLMANSNLQGIF